jgi:small subunit ribosomal protein S7
MPRRREVPKRDILPDPKFGNVEVSKFINAIMQSGKKSVAERIVYGAFDIISTKSGKDPSRFSARPWVMFARWSK